MAKKKSYKQELKVLKEDFNDLKKYLDELREILPVAICTLSSFGVVIDINKTAEILIGYKPLEIIGQPIEIFFYPKEDIVKLLKVVQKKEMIREKEITLVTKNKEKIPVSTSISLRKDPKGDPIGYFLTITDIIETKKYQKDLEKRTKELEKSRSALMNMLKDVEESKKALINVLEDADEARRRAEEERDKTQTIIVNLTDGLLVFDKEGNLSLVNPQAIDFFGVKEKDILDRPILELSVFPTIEPMVRLVGGGLKGVFRKELLIKENLTLEVSVLPMMRGEERFGTLIILHDITREKIIERMKTEFVSLAAHQLRTPLSAIKWTLRMLLDGDLGKITEEQRGFIEKTYKSNERMISLINALLNVTRIEEGRYIYKPVFAQIENIVQFVINSFKEETGRKKIKLEFKKPRKKLPEVKVDVEKTRLAINNLLDNAIKYTPSGGKVTVSFKYTKKAIKFSIKDTGVGIPKDQQERVFTKFFRGANVMRMDTEGTGLGLFITKNIIEAHGGKIWFESEENKGTTFFFTLPVKIKKEFVEFLKEF